VTPMTLAALLDRLAQWHCGVRRGHAWILRHDGRPGDHLVLECLHCLARSPGWDVVTRSSSRGPRPIIAPPRARIMARSTPIDPIVDAIDPSVVATGRGASARFSAQTSAERVHEVARKP